MGAGVPRAFPSQLDHKTLALSVKTGECESRSVRLRLHVPSVCFVARGFLVCFPIGIHHSLCRTPLEHEERGGEKLHFLAFSNRKAFSSMRLAYVSALV